MYVIDQPSKWKDYIHLVEFSYNNGYEESLKMIPFEELCGRKCNTPVSWDNPTEIFFIGLELLKEMEEKMAKIRHNLKDSRDTKNKYIEMNRFLRYFKVVEHVFLKVKVKRSSIILGCCPKLAARYCGPFEILEMIGLVAYMLAFPASMRVYNVFLLSLLNKYIPNANHIIYWNVIQVENEGDFWVESMHILGKKVKMIWKKSIGIVNIQWT
jgi:hypothetical protein